MSCNKCNNFIDLCDCNTTTTTTCSDVAEQPCITICSDIYSSECIIYDGEDNECYGVKKGDKLKDILDKIIVKLVGNDCSCEYGSATINVITTTTSTSTSTTTSTTTIPQNNLCFTLYEENSCDFIVKEITSGIFINGKESYYFTYDSTNYVIRWSIVNQRWELYLASNFAFPLAYLEVDSEHPVAPLEADTLTQPELSWKMYGVDSILVTTRECCPQELCGMFIIETGSFDVTFKSPYDILASLPSQPINLKHYYIGCVSLTDPEIYQIKWNLFTGRYELYFNDTFIAYTLQPDLEIISEINWIVNGSSEYVSIKTKTGSCPTTTTTTIIIG